MRNRETTAYMRLVRDELRAGVERARLLHNHINGDVVLSVKNARGEWTYRGCNRQTFAGLRDRGIIARIDADAFEWVVSRFRVRHHRGDAWRDVVNREHWHVYAIAAQHAAPRRVGAST